MLLRCDANHITTPHPEGAGLASCLKKALADGGVSIDEARCGRDAAGMRPGIAAGTQHSRAG